MKQYTEAIIEK